MNLSRRQPGSSSRPLVDLGRPDLAGRAVALSPAVPAGFDAPLSHHHKIIGRWVAQQAPTDQLFGLGEARRFIEQRFRQAVLDIIGVNTLADLRVFVLAGDGAGQPPTLAIICDSVGQIDMGWIELTNVLANTLKGSVAPVGWRAAAYGALHDLAAVLPMFGFHEMMEELSGYYWDGETDDEGARHALVTFHGQDPDELTLPSHIEARRPDYMLPENADPLKKLPPAIRSAIKRVTTAAKAVRAVKEPGSAWHFDSEQITAYLPEYGDAATLPALTLVPFDVYAQELDEIAQHGMEYGFHNIAGICQLTDAASIDRWFASLRLGTELIAAAQDLIDLDVSKVRP